MCNELLRFTSGTTHADHMAASIAVEPLGFVYLQIMYLQELVEV